MAPVPPAKKKVRVLVLGAGFAGLEFCKTLKDPQFEITLLDRQNHHLFQPLLYQVATASLGAPDIAAPTREVLAKRKNVSVLMDDVKRLDLPNKRVETASGVYHYDYLVIGLGVRSSYFGRPEWAQHAPGLKTLEEARFLRHQILTAVEQAELCEDPIERRRLLTIVIIGGGPTGVELAGAFTELIHRTLRDGFKRVKPEDLNVILLEAAPRLLGMFDPEQSHYAEGRLRGLGINVRTGTRVQDVREGEVVLEKDTLNTANIIWAAGMEANPVTASLDVPKDRAGRLVVKTDCSLPDYPEVFAVGDIAHCEDRNGVLVPGLAAAAMQMGKHVAKLIREEVKVKRGPQRDHAPLLRRQFAYFDKGIMAIIGKSAAVVKAGKFKMRGCRGEGRQVQDARLPGLARLAVCASALVSRIPQQAHRAHSVGIRLPARQSRRAHYRESGFLVGRPRMAILRIMYPETDSDLPDSSTLDASRGSFLLTHGKCLPNQTHQPMGGHWPPERRCSLRSHSSERPAPHDGPDDGE